MSMEKYVCIVMNNAFFYVCSLVINYLVKFLYLYIIYNVN